MMTLPLVVLAVLAVAGGCLNLAVLRRRQVPRALARAGRRARRGARHVGHRHQGRRSALIATVAGPARHRRRLRDLPASAPVWRPRSSSRSWPRAGATTRPSPPSWAAPAARRFDGVACVRPDGGRRRGQRRRHARAARVRQGPRWPRPATSATTPSASPSARWSSSGSSSPRRSSDARPVLAAEAPPTRSASRSSSAVVLTPVLGAVLVALVSRRRPEVRQAGRGVTAVVTGALTVGVAVAVRDQRRRLPARRPRPLDQGPRASPGSSGVDGISLWLVVLTGILFPIAMLGAPPHHDHKPFYAWLLVLEAGCLGVFLALDPSSSSCSSRSCWCRCTSSSAGGATTSACTPPPSSSSTPCSARRSCWWAPSPRPTSTPRAGWSPSTCRPSPRTRAPSPPPPAGGCSCPSPSPSR